MIAEECKLGQYRIDILLKRSCGFRQKSPSAMGSMGLIRLRFVKVLWVLFEKNN